MNKRKSIRPLDEEMPTHVVFKSARQDLYLYAEIIESTSRKFAERFGCHIFSIGVHADHVHFNLEFPSREAYIKWVRATSSQTSAKIPGLKWKLRPFTRIGEWGRDFNALQKYIAKNRGEGELFRLAIQTVATFDFEVSKSMRCDQQQV